MKTDQDSQRMHVAEPFAPALDSRHINNGKSPHTTSPLAAQEHSSGQLYMIGIWDTTPMQIRFDPDAPGETFYQAFHQWAVWRHRDGDLERDRIALWLKKSKSTPDCEAYELNLEEVELELLWAVSVDWIKENKCPKAPHLYATVKLRPR